MNKSNSLFALTLFAAIAASTNGMAKEESTKSAVQGTLKIENRSEAEFPALAKISIEDAMRIATEKVKGRILQVGLEKENGYLVYAVEAVMPDKETKELTIDAVSGRVLSVKNDPADKEKESEKDDN